MFKGAEKNRTIFRSLFYPPLKDSELEPGVIRCGQHHDYGSIILLMQDDMGGLEVGWYAWMALKPIFTNVIFGKRLCHKENGYRRHPSLERSLSIWVTWCSFGHLIAMYQRYIYFKVFQNLTKTNVHYFLLDSSRGCSGRRNSTPFTASINCFLRSPGYGSHHFTAGWIRQASTRWGTRLYPIPRFSYIQINFSLSFLFSLLSCRWRPASLFPIFGAYFFSKNKTTRLCFLLYQQGGFYC